MLAMLSTFVILTAAAFAMIVMGMTLAGSWNLVVAALNASAAVPATVSTQRRTAGHRPITVSYRERAPLSNVAA